MDTARRRRALTLIEVLIALTLMVIVVLLAHVMVRARRRGVDCCCSNLKQLGIATRLYLDGQGRRTRWPDRSGSDFLILLYVTGVTSDSGSFLCRWSGDTNDEGGQLLLGLGSGKTNATSFAGRRNASPAQTTYPGLFTTRNSSETTMAADDEDGPPHHIESTTILFADGHTEHNVPLDEPRLGRVGAGGLLDPLGN